MLGLGATSVWPRARTASRPSLKEAKLHLRSLEESKVMTLAKFPAAVLLLLVGLAAPPCASAQTSTVLYSFTGGADGAYPNKGIVRGPDGSLYGTTQGLQTGTVYKIRPNGAFKVIHSFPVPYGVYDWPFSGLVLDSAGSVYGSVFYDGTYGVGFVYRVDKHDNFTVLYNFTEAIGFVGNGTYEPLILDAAGNLYGPGGGGGKVWDGGSCGMIFKIDPSGNETQIRAFAKGKGGVYPNGGLLRDASGDLYGTTLNGGSPGGFGVVYKLGTTGKETVLYTFGPKPDGSSPNGELLQDAAGNLYGTTVHGGANDCGTIYKLGPSGNKTTLYTFTCGADGQYPGPLITDAAGNFYGFAELGGSGHGLIFKLDLSGNETTFYRFPGGAKGDWPMALTMDEAGNFYGTTAQGGDLSCANGDGCGVVFKLTP
jgi:uncharacterized repeat protein (TIGR03803 family)